MGKLKSGLPSALQIFYLFLLLQFPVLQLLSFASAADQRIKVVVVLVLENRSFDHMLGWMKSVSPEIDGLSGTEYNPTSTKEPHSRFVNVSDDAGYVEPDPGHSFDAVYQQVFGSDSNPSMMGFLEQALSLKQNQSEVVMKGFRPSALPVFSKLVEEFAVFDRWFSSLPGPTQPNRLFVYSATSHGAISHVKSQLLMGYPQKTVFDSLHDDGVNFGIYFESFPTTLFYRNLRKLKFTFKFHSYSRMFKKHASTGMLPSLCVIEPTYFDTRNSPANDDHPSHDVSNGQQLVKEVYQTLRSSPQWNETLLVITYDEHGGFFDHVMTPQNIPSPDGIASSAPQSFQFDRLGVRVPTIMVSPWIKKGTVIHKPSGPTPTSEFEHSSIPATIKKMFNLSSNFLTYRDAWAGTFENVVSELKFPRTDCPDILPDVLPLRTTEAQEDRDLSEFQREIVHLSAVLNGDHYRSGFPDEISDRMKIKQAHVYVQASVARFIRASKEAFKMGADESAVVDMRSSLTSRSTFP